MNSEIKSKRNSTEAHFMLISWPDADRTAPSSCGSDIGMCGLPESSGPLGLVQHIWDEAGMFLILPGEKLGSRDPLAGGPSLCPPPSQGRSARPADPSLLIQLSFLPQTCLGRFSPQRSVCELATGESESVLRADCPDCACF